MVTSTSWRVLANLLAQVLKKHDDIRPSLSKEDRFEQYCNRLETIAPQLSNREIQISRRDRLVD